MGQSQQSTERPKDFIGNYTTKNLDDNIRDYSSYPGIKSNTVSLNTESPTNETSIRSRSESMQSESKDLIEVNFIWKEGGNDIYVTGSFVNSKQWFNLERTGDSFQRKILLPKEKHLFKFIVDNDWKNSSFYDKTTDEKGNVNNVIDLKVISASNKEKPKKACNEDKTPKTKTETNNKKLSVNIDNSPYSEVVPDRRSLNNEAPVLPSSYNSKFCLNNNLSQLLKGKNQYLDYDVPSLHKLYSNSNSSSKQILKPPHVNM